MFKFLKIFLILILVIALAGIFFRNSICRLLIIHSTAQATGLKVTIEDLNLNILRSSLHLSGVTLYSPAGFKNGNLGKAKEIFVNYDVLGLIEGRLHLPLVKIDIAEINIIRNEEGKSNVSAFKRGKSQQGYPKRVTTNLSNQEKAKIKKCPRFLIDRLELTIAKATFIDYRAGVGEPAIIIFTVKGPYVFKDVSDLGEVVGSVSAKGGFRRILENLLGVIPQDILKTTTDAIKKNIQSVVTPATPR